MDTDLVLILRMLERLMVVGFGGMAIFLGYKLFFHLPYQSDQEGKLELPGIKIVLSRVAPGTFFLAFGALILSQNLNQGISQSIKLAADTTNNTTETVQSFAGVTGGLSAEHSNIQQKRIAAIEQIGEINCLKKLLAVKKIQLQPSISIALSEAKTALLKPVWNQSAWGDISILDFGLDNIKNPNLRGVFSDVSVACPY
ncbi:hypothetical protein [methane-oxidizing endosymbiont of Gigantopelta aegis]|uniref:hypothetical protein n=1 Tax=methane-oxidizing endosymbiont of Gigantopelta aegis TaxID=2794938 RepID=UPI0018DB5E9D|nr:hypothetical protein [methane-oxidizing endosymbiont of Gigantopelta aegis]